MIIEVDHPAQVPDILRLAENVPDISFNEIRRRIIDGLGKPDTKIIVHKRKEGITGFIYATIERIDGQDVVFIQIAYVAPSMEKIGYELLNRIKSWAKEKQLEWIYTMTPRNPKPFMRKYKFEFYAHVLRRRI